MLREDALSILKDHQKVIHADTDKLITFDCKIKLEKINSTADKKELQIIKNKDGYAHIKNYKIYIYFKLMLYYHRL